MKRLAIIVTGLICAACSETPQTHSAASAPVAYASNERADFSLAYETLEAERDMKAAYTTDIRADDGAALGEVDSYSVDRYGRILEASPSDRAMEPADAPAETRWGEPVV